MSPSQTVGILSDEEVISHVLAGEVELYEAIIRKYNAYLYKVGRSFKSVLS